MAAIWRGGLGALVAGVCLLGALPSMADSRSNAAVEVDEARLWLPKSLADWRYRLLAAARVAAAEPRCTELLEGTWDESHSSVKRPVFRFVCRDDAGQSYSVRYDGQALKPLSTQALVDELLTPEQRALQEARTSAERARQRAAQADTFGADCERLLAARTATFRGVAPTPLTKEPGELVFRAQFTAIDPSGRTLYFSAECRPGPAREPMLTLAPVAGSR